MVRDQIKDLREVHEQPIVCLPTPRGVWLAQTPEEVDLEIACQHSRLESLSRSIARLQRVRERMAYRETLFDH
jgi:hypothetical protein